MKPRVSVVMTTFNAARHVREALESLRRQTLADHEVVVVDDSSTDGTAGILSAMARREPRLRVITLRRAGRGASLNCAVRAARAPFVANLDADDVALPHRLAAQLAALEADPALVLVGSAQAVLIDGDGRHTGTVRLHKEDASLRRGLKRTCQFFHSSAMYRKSAWAAAGGFDERMRCYEDYDLWVRMAPLGRMRNLDVPLSLKRRHAVQTFQSRHETNYGYRQRAKVMLRHFATIEQDPRTLARAALYLGMGSRLHNWYWNDARKARRNALRIVRPAPGSRPTPR